MNVDGLQRAMTRQVRCAWEVYAAKELGMSAGESLRAFDNWVESLSENPVRPYGTVTDTAGDVREWRPEDGDSRCQRCGARNPVWWAENKQWNAAVGGPDATEDPGGILCPTCYHALWLRAAARPSEVRS